MNYRLKNQMMVPPEKFYYLQPETGYRSRDESLHDAISDVLNHRKVNGLPRATIEEVSEDVQTQICQRVGDQWCDNMEVGAWNFPITWEKIANGTKMLATFAKTFARGGSPYVENDEAERRAKICSTCVFNQRNGGCWGCGIGAMVEALVAESGNGHTTSVDDRLNSCQICSCYNRIQVHVRGDILKSSMTEKEEKAYKEVMNCWKSDL